MSIAQAARERILDVRIEFSAKLGVRELPRLDGRHQSNIKGLYVVGDLADAPIIKVALRQGHDVAMLVCDELGAVGEGSGETLDVLVVGAGPAGIGAGLALQERGARFVIVERERPFATIQNFPKAKLIFSEPREVESPGNLWFEDARKEDLVERWDAALDEKSLPIRQPEEVVDIRRVGDRFEVRTHTGGTRAEGGAEHRLRAKRVILASGKRGHVGRLGVPGEDLAHVAHALRDPAAHAGQRVVVVGGGDSGVEAACDIAEAGGSVVLSCRSDQLSKSRPRNLARIGALAEQGKVTLRLGTSPREITETDVRLVPSRGQGEVEDVPADAVFVLIGTRMPRRFLHKIGLKMAGEMDWVRALWIAVFALTTWCFYVLKHKKGFFPFGEGDPLAVVPGLLEVDLGFRQVDASFWGTAIYSLLILGFGIRAYRRYPLPEQKKRYLSLIGFQWAFLFGIPELIAPLVIERPWKLYALSVPWPLSIWSLVDAPGWTPNGDTLTAALWLLVGAVSAFVLVPLYVRRNGERFCSYLCGCGGLAETLGDFWRHLAPRGRDARRSEWFGRAILLLAVPVTLLILNDAWGFVAKDALYDTKAFAQQWYGLMVDFALASVVGVAFYPYLGNRVWCRFFCPLRAWMEVLARRFSRIAIQSNDRCIGCGECTRACQMGIDVQRFAQRQDLMSNANSACIQCGICIQVCPMEVLSITRDRPVALDGVWALGPSKASWEQ